MNQKYLVSAGVGFGEVVALWVAGGRFHGDGRAFDDHEDVATVVGLYRNGVGKFNTVHVVKMVGVCGQVDQAVEARVRAAGGQQAADEPECGASGGPLHARTTDSALPFRRR